MNKFNSISNYQIIEALRCNTSVGSVDICGDCDNVPFCYASVKEVNKLIADRLEHLMMKRDVYNDCYCEDDDDGWRDE